MRNFWITLTLASLVALSVSHTAKADVISFGSGSNQFNMEFVEIGSPGNPDDTGGGISPDPAGKVDYTYQMGKFEVSEDMITKFNASQSLTITKDARGTDKPATSVSWNEAARFVNWLNTSTGGTEAYKFTTSGVNDNIALWAPGDLGYDATNPFRNSRATYVLPSMDEWYKAAYYNPSTGTYFNYPSSDGSIPTAVASGTAANTAVYDFQAGPADIMSAGGLSPYGIMGLGGNVFEWEETQSNLANDDGSSSRGVRGGFCYGISVLLSSSTRNLNNPAIERVNFGFRVASPGDIASVAICLGQNR